MGSDRVVRMTRIHLGATVRIYSSILAAAMLAISTGSASAADESIREKAAQCAPCHGEGGISQTENTPSLAGQPDLFLQWQLVFLRSGSRKNEVMQPIAEQLGNEDVRNLSAYFASLPPPKASEPDDNPDLSKKGAQAAAGRHCGLPCPPKRAACHVRAIVTLMYCAPGYLPLEMRAQMWFQTQLIRRQRTSTRVVVRAP